MRLCFLHRLEYLALDARDFNNRPIALGLQTEPKDWHPSMYIGVELPAILKPLYSSISYRYFT
jgi:hypothetical protein